MCVPPSVPYALSVLTSEVIHEAGLGSNDPLGSCLAEDGDVAFWTLAECG